MKTKSFFIIFSLLAGFCLLLACSKTDDSLPIESYSDVDQYADVSMLNRDSYLTMVSTRMDVHYKVIGKGPVNIVFIPGWTNPLEVYSKQFEYFSDKARCIYIDLPGQGLSDAPEGVNYTMDLMANAVYDVLKKEEVNDFAAVGFSMGTAVLGQFERNHPGRIAKLVNLDGGFSPWPPVGDPARDRYIAHLGAFCTSMSCWTSEDKKAFASLLIPETCSCDLKEFVEYFCCFPCCLMTNIYRNSMAEEVNQPVGWSYPIMSIYSSQPADMEYEQLYFPDADIHVMEGNGHVLQWARYEIVNPLIWNFISEGKKYVPQNDPLTFTVE